MRRPIIVATILGIGFALATLGLLVVSMTRSAEYSCRVCMSYLGRTDCRDALGATRDEAVRTAKDSACALLTAGMTQVVECGTRTQPLSVTCEGD